MIRTVMRIVVALAVLGLVSGCAARRGAPVVERAPEARPAPARSAVAARPAPRGPETRPEFYTVRRGDTLFSIALDHGLEYRELAQWNGISDPAKIVPGQQIRLRPPPATATTAPALPPPGVEGRPLAVEAQAAAPEAVKDQPRAVRAPYSEKTYARLAAGRQDPAQTARLDARPPAAEGESSLNWGWPARGKVIGTFGDGGSLKGISIAGKIGQPVLASEAGRVIFSGTGIRGFGKLIVIKHNEAFISVYAHNSELLVKEGQTVARGQQIAEMGSTDSDRVKLHFEIRRFGKPVDPMKLLPSDQAA